MKNNQHEQLFTELTAEFEATPAFHELDDEVAATCSGGRIFFGGADPDVILFEDSQYRGRALRVNATSGDGDSNLTDQGFNDKTSSIKVIRGTWQIYEHANYTGRTTTLRPGDYYTPPFGRRPNIVPNDSLTGIRRVG
jgi:hypothetical protein